MAEYKKILFSREGAISTITFNRPRRTNALDKEMSDECRMQSAVSSVIEIAAF